MIKVFSVVYSRSHCMEMFTYKGIIYFFGEQSFYSARFACYITEQNYTNSSISKFINSQEVYAKWCVLSISLYFADFLKLYMLKKENVTFVKSFFFLFAIYRTPSIKFRHCKAYFFQAVLLLSSIFNHLPKKGFWDIAEIHDEIHFPITATTESISKWKTLLHYWYFS